MVELVASFIIGLLAGVVVQAYFRPLSALIERISRRHWADPLIINVERDPSLVWYGYPDWMPFSVYIDDPTRLPRPLPPDRAEWMAAVRSANAVDAYMTSLKITLQARVEAAVVVERVRVVEHRQVPLSHGIILTRTTGGADITPRRIEIGLDLATEPIIAWKDSGNAAIDAPGIKLAAGEVERFHVWAIAHSTRQSIWHEWSIVLDLLVEGTKVEWPISDRGQPFVTVSPGDLPQRYSAYGSDDWSDSLP